MGYHPSWTMGYPYCGLSTYASAGAFPCALIGISPPHASGFLSPSRTQDPTCKYL
ncbi:hypothetical protein Pint_12013 [Pistacia integerrima]|uniref:Uncharacterized protein n=1 Tax=Pistacia integerrima TaxID=434235 RepID=A0ACC0XI52_9ROSI|nr:hypothetical protein Pint_12013 [Pistacia integerrima]